jgi:hypothetical protein
MAMKTRKEEEKQTKMPMDYKFKKQCIVNLSKKREGNEMLMLFFDHSVGHSSLKVSINSFELKKYI